MKKDVDHQIAKLLYEQAVAEEIYPEELDGESYEIHEMLREMRTIGYPFTCFSDLKFRRIKDPQVMQILLRYYSKMESIYTKGHFLKQIDPKKFPIVLELALKEYNLLSPLDKKDISAFQEVLAKGSVNNEYIAMLLSILEIPDNYASSFLIRERLLKIAPESLKKLTIFYSEGILFPATLKEYAAYRDVESEAVLKRAAEITEYDIKQLQNNNSYILSSTMHEYWKKCCSVKYIRTEAKKLLKKKM